MMRVQTKDVGVEWIRAAVDAMVVICGYYSIKPVAQGLFENLVKPYFNRGESPKQAAEQVVAKVVKQQGKSLRMKVKKGSVGAIDNDTYVWRNLDMLAKEAMDHPGRTANEKGTHLMRDLDLLPINGTAFDALKYKIELLMNTALRKQGIPTKQDRINPEYADARRKRLRIMKKKTKDSFVPDSRMFDNDMYTEAVRRGGDVDKARRAAGFSADEDGDDWLMSDEEYEADKKKKPTHDGTIDDFMMSDDEYSDAVKKGERSDLSEEGNKPKKKPKKEKRNAKSDTRS